MKRRLLVSKAAEADLLEIWLLEVGSYTAESFGVSQADRYLERLASGLRACATSPNRGRRRDDLRPGYRSVLIRRPVAFYTLTTDTVLVHRVLHGSMDPDGNLDDE